MGISPSDLSKLKKVVIQLAMALKTGIDYFYSLSIFELFDLVEEVAEVVSERERTKI